MSGWFLTLSVSSQTLLHIRTFWVSFKHSMALSHPILITSEYFLVEARYQEIIYKHIYIYINFNINSMLIGPGALWLSSMILWAKFSVTLAILVHIIYDSIFSCLFPAKVYNPTTIHTRQWPLTYMVDNGHLCHLTGITKNMLGPHFQIL